MDKKSKCPVTACCTVAKHLWQCCSRPINKNNILHHYVPLLGTGCYTALGLHVVKPSILNRYFTQTDPTNLLLACSVTGSVLYIYDCKHLRSLVGKDRIAFSFFVAGMFNLGSLLFWAMIRSATLERRFVPLRIVLSLGASWFLTRMGFHYLKTIDDQIKDDGSRK